MQAVLPYAPLNRVTRTREIATYGLSITRLTFHSFMMQPVTIEMYGLVAPELGSPSCVCRCRNKQQVMAECLSVCLLYITPPSALTGDCWDGSAVFTVTIRHIVV